MTEDYDPAAIRVLEGMEPPRRRPRGHVVDDLPEAERIALEVWRLGVRARILANAGDPGSVEAEAAFRKAEAEAVEAGHVMRRVDAPALRSRHPVLARDAEIAIGVGWQTILEDLLRSLDGFSVTVRLVREKFGGLDVKVYPAPRWIGDEIERVGQLKGPAVEASLRTCEACGAPGTLRRNGRGRTRCDAHAEM
jgi:hypothetical protein